MGMWHLQVDFLKELFGEMLMVQIQSTWSWNVYFVQKPLNSQMCWITDLIFLIKFCYSVICIWRVLGLVILANVSATLGDLELWFNLIAAATDGNLINIT